MISSKVKACINLYAVLRNMEDLCSMDPWSRNLIAKERLWIKFKVAGGPIGVLDFHEGRCIFQRGNGSCDVLLYFPTPKHFNEMMDGKKMPIVLKGFHKIGFLKDTFPKLAKRLEMFLKPMPELLADPAFYAINTTLTAYTAFFALAEIGNGDDIGKLNAGRIPDGLIRIAVQGGPSVTIHAKDGRLAVQKGEHGEARAFMLFDSMETAGGILSGKLDTYTCMGDGRLVIKGFIPMMDNLNKLLAQVPAYLK